MKGELAAGERLVEAALSERLQASRTPVRSALLMLEQQGLVQRAHGGGYMVRKYTGREIAEAIAVHAHLEGMCARLVAEQGVSRKLSDELQACLDEGDQAVRPQQLDMDAIAAYLSVNTRFHKLIVDASGNNVLKQCLQSLDRIPFAAAGGMLPFQSKLPDSDEVMRFAQRQHHMLVEALRKGQSARAGAGGRTPGDCPAQSQTRHGEHRGEGRSAARAAPGHHVKPPASPAPCHYPARRPSGRRHRYRLPLMKGNAR